MVNCPNCGSKVSEEMSFCPKCGAALKVEQAAAPEAKPTVVYRRDEKDEKREKGEKEEKGEKHEKRQYSFIGPLIGGLILIMLGLTAFMEITGYVEGRTVWAVFFVIIGLLIIIGAVYGAMLASRRHPRA